MFLGWGVVSAAERPAIALRERVVCPGRHDGDGREGVVCGSLPTAGTLVH